MLLHIIVYYYVLSYINIYIYIIFCYYILYTIYYYIIMYYYISINLYYIFYITIYYYIYITIYYYKYYILLYFIIWILYMIVLLATDQLKHINARTPIRSRCFGCGTRAPWASWTGSCSTMRASNMYRPDFTPPEMDPRDSPNGGVFDCIRKCNFR